MVEGSSQNAMKEATPPPVAEAHQLLSNMVSDVTIAVEGLVDRISTVLGPDFPRDSAPSEDLSDRSEIARALTYEAIRLRDLIEVVHSVHARVEL